MKAIFHQVWYHFTNLNEEEQNKYLHRKAPQKRKQRLQNIQEEESSDDRQNEPKERRKHPAVTDTRNLHPAVTDTRNLHPAAVDDAVHSKKGGN